MAGACVPDANGVIHACYGKSGGNVRVLDAANAICGGNETSLTWNQDRSGRPDRAAGSVRELDPHAGRDGRVGVEAQRGRAVLGEPSGAPSTCVSVPNAPGPVTELQVHVGSNPEVTIRSTRTRSAEP